MEFSDYLKINNEKTLTRRLIYEIRERNPESVRFTVDEFAVKGVMYALRLKSYSTILYSYGHLFLLELLRYYEDLEKYEDCHLIKNTILEHNKYLKDKLTTKIR